MTKTMQKVASSKNSKSQPILHGVHVTPNKMEATNRHVAIVETFKTPVETMTGDIVLSPEGVPVMGNYPDLERLIPLDSYGTMMINGKKLLDILKIKKGAEKAKLYSDDGEKVRIRFDNDMDSFEIGVLSGDLDETHFNPAYLLLMVEEVKEIEGRIFKDNTFIVSWKSSLDPIVMTCDNDQVDVQMLVTPIRQY